MTKHLAYVAKEIISEMFRWGVINEGSKYFSLDLRTMSDEEAIETICDMDANGIITSNVMEDFSRSYYVSPELIITFVTENWKLKIVDESVEVKWKQPDIA